MQRVGYDQLHTLQLYNGKHFSGVSAGVSGTPRFELTDGKTREAHNIIIIIMRRKTE